MTHAEQVNRCILSQNSPRLPWETQTHGCRVMCLLAIPQYVTGQCLESYTINGIIDRGLVTPGVITNNAEVKMLAGTKEHELINWGFAALGSSRRGAQVGEIRHGEPVYWGWYESEQWEYMLVDWETAGPIGHYTLHDRASEMLYDPHDPEMAGYGIEFRGIRRQLLYATWSA